VPIKYAGFTTCSKAGYQNFPEHFSKLMLEQLDNKSNVEKMQEFFQVLSQSYQDINFTDDRFIALSKLCIEGMLSQDYVNVIKQSGQANFLAKCLIKMKHTDTLTTENKNFIISYPGSLIIPVSHILIALDKAGLNTLANRESLASFPMPLPLHRTIKALEKKGLLTQENFDLISAENNLSWLLALEEMPEALITADIWQGLVNLSKNSNENDFKKDIKDYAEMLKNKLNVEQIKKDILASKEHIETQAVTSIARPRFFSVTPTSLTPSAADEVPKVNFAL
jgi:hypothetical protein